MQILVYLVCRQKRTTPTMIPRNHPYYFVFRDRVSHWPRVVCAGQADCYHASEICTSPPPQHWAYNHLAPHKDLPFYMCFRDQIYSFFILSISLAQNMNGLFHYIQLICIKYKPQHIIQWIILKLFRFMSLQQKCMQPLVLNDFFPERLCKIIQTLCCI